MNLHYLTYKIEKMKLKPIKITDYYSPSIPILKIDVAAPFCQTANTSVSQVNACSKPKTNNLLGYVVLGVLAIAGGLYLLHRYNKKEEEKQNNSR